MRTGDLIDVLCDYGDMPMTLTGPDGKRLMIQRIESVSVDGLTELEIELGHWAPTSTPTPLKRKIAYAFDWVKNSIFNERQLGAACK